MLRSTSLRSLGTCLTIILLVAGCSSSPDADKPLDGSTADGNGNDAVSTADTTNDTGADAADTTLDTGGVDTGGDASDVAPGDTTGSDAVDTSGDVATDTTADIVDGGHTDGGATDTSDTSSTSDTGTSDTSSTSDTGTSDTSDTSSDTSDTGNDTSGSFTCPPPSSGLCNYVQYCCNKAGIQKECIYGGTCRIPDQIKSDSEWSCKSC